jgi:hypothetical protein
MSARTGCWLTTQTSCPQHVPPTLLLLLLLLRLRLRRRAAATLLAASTWCP